MIVTKAGIDVSKFFHSISPKEDAIKIPTVISAGAVTADVTTDNNPEQNNTHRYPVGGDFPPLVELELSRGVQDC